MRTKLRRSRFNRNASRVATSFDGVHRGIVIVASARCRHAIAQAETIATAYLILDSLGRIAGSPQAASLPRLTLGTGSAIFVLDDRFTNQLPQATGPSCGQSSTRGARRNGARRLRRGARRRRRRCAHRCSDPARRRGRARRREAGRRRRRGRHIRARRLRPATRRGRPDVAVRSRRPRRALGSDGRRPRRGRRLRRPLDRARRLQRPLVGPHPSE